MRTNDSCEIIIFSPLFVCVCSNGTCTSMATIVWCNRKKSIQSGRNFRGLGSFLRRTEHAITHACVLLFGRTIKISALPTWAVPMPLTCCTMERCYAMLLARSRHVTSFFHLVCVFLYFFFYFARQNSFDILHRLASRFRIWAHFSF